MASEASRFDQLNVVVSDMEASIAFYRRLGLVIPDADPAWQAHHRTVETPGGVDLDFDSVAFARRWDAGWPGQSGIVIGFRLGSRDAVDARYAELTAAGYTGQQAPCDAFWGARYAVVEDPDGNAVGLMSPADPEHRSAPVEP
jgi:catechol 2,3-dioxygenase-like lactoylglutathione lyase family enzyme